MNISFCVTTYNRYELTKQCVESALKIPQIDDIVIMDDASTDGSYEELVYYYGNHAYTSVLTQANNVGMSRNKADAIRRAKNDWCIIFDSDNVINKAYVDSFYDHVINRDAHADHIIYCPTFARPQFDYRKYAGALYSKSNVASAIKNDVFNMAMNTCNYVVNKDAYASVYKYSSLHKASDTIWFNYNWLKQGNWFYFVPGMEYDHLIHEGSGFMQDVDYNMNMSAHVRKMIAQL